MASWSTRRKYTYLTILLIVLAVFIIVPLYYLLYEAPTCSDGKRNGGERGVDCGGPCVRLCAADHTEPRVLWSYSSPVVRGVYNAMAYVQNPNQAAEALRVPYVFKLYDDQGLLVAQREGWAYVPAGQIFVVFEGGLQAGERVPTRTTFEFVDTPSWRQGNVLSGMRVVSIDVEEGNSPRAQAKVFNETVDRTFSQVDAFIVLYDTDNNRTAFSKTVVENLSPGETTTLYFTWPLSFVSPILRSEVVLVERPR